MVELHRCKVCGVIFGTEGHVCNASICPTCSKQEDQQPEAPMGEAE